MGTDAEFSEINKHGEAKTAQGQLLNAKLAFVDIQHHKA